MPSITNLNQLDHLTDFTQLNLNDDSLLVENDKLTTVRNTAVQYAEADENCPTGTWVVNGHTTTAGAVMAASFYKCFLEAENSIQTHLTAMSVNVNFANASGKFASAIRSANDTSSKSYADLVNLATPLVGNLGISVEDFLKLVLPNESPTAVYTATQFGALVSTVDQFSNAKLTDNSVLQEKFNVANSNRSSCLESLTNLLKAWTSFLQNLGKGVM